MYLPVLDVRTTLRSPRAKLVLEVQAARRLGVQALGSRLASPSASALPEAPDHVPCGRRAGEGWSC